MKKPGSLHSELLLAIAELGHLDEFIIGSRSNAAFSGHSQGVFI